MSTLVSRLVVCGGCGATMQPVKILALVTWRYSSGKSSFQRYWQYECGTSDCGNSVQVEED
jgi:hypothetical protein